MPEGGALTLRTRVVGSASAPRLIELEVSDTGSGMDEEARRRCLEPFFTTKGERGTGLGLAMVYGMVQRHRAMIEIESALGRGTTMRFSFPEPAESAHVPAQSQTALAMPKDLRILVVDDDPAVLKSLQDALQGDGHSIVTASGGQAGIAAFLGARAQGNPFHAVITDLGMPYVDGRQVCAAVKAAAPHTIVVLLTGWGQRFATEGDTQLNVDSALSKPPKLRELREALARGVQAVR